MILPERSEFIELSKKGNLIPVYKELVADMETPVSAFMKIKGRNSYLLESVEGGENIARYSFLGSDPLLTISAKGRNIVLTDRGRASRFKDNPINALKNIMARYRPVKINGLPRFHGGLVGYLSYDIARSIEKLPDKNPDDLKVPDMVFLLTDTMLAFDHVNHKILIISNVLTGNDPAKAYDKAVKKIRDIEAKLLKPLKHKKETVKKSTTKMKFTSNFTKAQFEAVVSKAIKYVKSGDVIQVVPSQRLRTHIDIPPFNIYRALRTLNPSPYMYYLQLDGMEIVGASPETMVRLENGTATIRPIAGTRKRGTNDEEDALLAKELLADEKEKAEHIMLVDLGRNDLGRVCKFDTIKINELMAIEKYSHVMHIVSDISGKLKKDTDAFDLIRASFPAGTVTGAPKVRAMEIIDELENVRRGTYAGAVGYFDFYGNMDTCITIRTILIRGKTAYVQAGAGIVADSVPSKEYEETMNKAGALLKAIELAHR